MDTATPDNSPSPSDTTASDGQAGIQEDKPAVNLPGLDIKNKRITVANDDFGLWIYQLYTNMEKYKGYTVIMTGFVFKDETMEANEFVPARLAMTCCVADLSPCGLLCKYDKASGLKADAWVTVEGTLHMGKYKQDGEEYEEPQISVTKITPAREVKGYVYPY
jgi:putative membrane protein